MRKSNQFVTFSSSDGEWSSPPTPLQDKMKCFDSATSCGEGCKTVLEVKWPSPLAILQEIMKCFDSATSCGEGCKTALEVHEPLITYSRELRKNQTRAEKLLWDLLRNRKFNGLKFRRQHPIKPSFILDFFCVEKKLAIELDGRHHEEPAQKRYDKFRTGVLSLLGIKVIRFKNHEVFNEIENVLKQILSSCIENPPNSIAQNNESATIPSPDVNFNTKY